MEVNELREKLTEYVDLITQIRILSAVQIDAFIGAEGYSKKLREDYKQIGDLGLQSRVIIKDYLEPIMHSAAAIDHELLLVLQDFCDMLLNPSSGEELDLFLLYELSARLLKEFATCEDDDHYAIQLNMHLSVCYAIVNKTARITVSRELNTSYRDEGLQVAEIAKDYFYNREKFASLSENARSSIMRVIRFYSALYDTFFAEEETNIKRYQALVDALQASDDPFYQEMLPNYNWKLHRIRCIEHMSQLTECGNRWGITKEQCNKICQWLELLEQAWEEDQAAVSEIIPEAHYRLVLLRNAYYAGKIEVQDYQKKLLALYEQFSNNSYDMYSVQMNLLIPAEYLSTIKQERLSMRLEGQLVRMYHQVIEYVLGSINMDAFNYLQEYLMGFLNNFIEIPGAITFEDMGLYCMAAIHPPTYVHSLQVADLSKCLAGHLINYNPELFVEDNGYQSVEEVKENRNNIMQFLYQGALCHDFGKISMMDSIFIYGRNLLDSEFQIIKLHTLMGDNLLSRYESTLNYASIARQHHLWYDLKGGYPLTLKSWDKLVASNIVEIADCIDAATDSIGRSYCKGKTFEQVCKEIAEGAGTRYAPYIAELLEKDEVVEDLCYLLSEGRQRNYKNTYLLLTGVKDRIQI